MSMTFSAPATQGLVGQPRIGGLGASLKDWWIAYLTGRIERAAIAHLSSMSDRELKDIGLVRSDIRRAVRGAPGDRPFSQYC